MAKPKDRVQFNGKPAPLTQSLAGLAAFRSQLQPGPAIDARTGAPATTVGSSETSTLDAISRAAKLVLRRERKGHGGKTATRIEGLDGDASELDATLRDVKRTLGCGATRDGGDILVQGDQVLRLVAYLESRCAKKIVVGN